MRSFFVPAGTLDTVIGGALKSTHFRVGPQSKLGLMADAAVERQPAEASRHAARKRGFTESPPKRVEKSPPGAIS
jgi:hypothetical protein